jgi:hypothetical protein
MKGRGSSFGIALLALCLPMIAYGDASTSPGKHSVHASANDLSLPGFQTSAVLTPLLTGTIAKGLPKRILMVHGLLTSIGAGENAYIKPRCNGVDFEPTDDFGNGSASSVNCPADATLACSASGSWWLDLDAAEAAHPGVFIGKPLVIELLGFTNLYNGIPGPLVANMSAQLDRK